MRVHHGAIELPTGSGKSLITQKICHARPVKTVVVAPLSAIADQLYCNFVEAFGPRYVGKYGDGSKKFDKLFTIAVAQSLTRLGPDDVAFKELKETQQIIFDEAHVTPAETFDKVCTGLFRYAPYRYFVSATQLRTDGCELILKGITGPIVYRKSFRELVEQGFLAQPRVKMFHVASSGATGLRDAKAETRRQLYTNPNVCSAVGRTASKMVNGLDRQMLILVEEFRQFHILKNYITVPFTFVHGGVTKEVKEFLEPQYHDCNIKQAIADFNSGKTRLMIGTSAISTGTDLRPTGCLAYLQGGLSEIKVRQAIGRGTRIVPGKKDFFVIDFIVEGSDTMERHGDSRVDIYKDMTDDIQEVRL